MQRLVAILPRFDVLTALVTFPDGLTMSELAGKLGVSKGNVTGVVGGLRRQGLVDQTRRATDRISSACGMLSK